MLPGCVAGVGTGNEMEDEAQRRTQALNSQQRREFGRFAQLGDRNQMRVEDAIAQIQAGDLEGRCVSCHRHVHDSIGV